MCCLCTQNNFHAAKNGRMPGRQQHNLTHQVTKPTKKKKKKKKRGLFISVRISNPDTTSETSASAPTTDTVSGLSIQLAAAAKRRPPVLASHSAWRHTRQGAKNPRSEIRHLVPLPVLVVAALPLQTSRGVQERLATLYHSTHSVAGEGVPFVVQWPGLRHFRRLGGSR
ncbi:hypothetical protein LZ31DRAFT_122932 [Colletotrichum somersetense]|nr:hypothetical protein LZ31DRAFT_122932 [Colletotrichum somersetense]